MNINIVYFGSTLSTQVEADLGQRIQHIHFSNDFTGYTAQCTLLTLPDVIMIEADGNESCFQQVSFIRQHPILKGIILILVGQEENIEWRKKSLELKVNDYYLYPFPIDDFIARVNFLLKFKSLRRESPQLGVQMARRYEMPFSKRVFDVVASSTALALLSPLLAFIAILIKIDSKGPVIYKSKRVGAGYSIFDFYKFRSMRSDADKMLTEMATLNQYSADKAGEKVAFVKFREDPRITPLGKFLRKTSLDELPQLFNVVLGDMSLVGNRPLPLYEAEQLTTDKWSTRFNGPAGLTGLWQISKRGQRDMSESERKELDNYYADNYSIFLDFKIIIKTIPALIQKESV